MVTVISCRDILLCVLGFFFPPLAAFIKRRCSADFIINCALTILGHVPGVIHAWYLIYKYPAATPSDILPTAQAVGHGGQHHGAHIIVVTPSRAGYQPLSTNEEQPVAASSTSDAPPSYGSIAKDSVVSPPAPRDQKP
ncbi:hypothetical protein IWQ62_005680 [Dispira parvispora]|uniref:Uncharacterized protein n=1 Tax=Dispira parvispora TaxID=1520584 RepID=A0A9W8AJY3_9FUNG|nr:hypothetical protein IWQ62_005680 [Dispira parvispora]